jgi:hypothetical protein
MNAKSKPICTAPSLFPRLAPNNELNSFIFTNFHRNAHRDAHRLRPPVPPPLLQVPPWPRGTRTAPGCRDCVCHSVRDFVVRARDALAIMMGGVDVRWQQGGSAIGEGGEVVHEFLCLGPIMKTPMNSSKELRTIPHPFLASQGYGFDSEFTSICGLGDDTSWTLQPWPRAGSRIHFPRVSPGSGRREIASSSPDLPKPWQP